MIIDSFGSPTIHHDLRVFDRGFGLPGPPSLRVLQPVGKVPPYNPDNPGGRSRRDHRRRGGRPRHSPRRQADGGFRTHPVVDWPASDPLVTAVGGTTLHLTAGGSRISPDSAWNESGSAVVARYAGALPWVSSGGVSAIFARPAYQDPVRAIVGNRRGIPDVALSASFSGASLTFESFTGAPGTWKLAAGTSVVTPYFAGIVAIADQALHARLGLLNPALYRLEQERAPGIVGVTQGSNTVSFTQDGKTITVSGYRARPGYNLVTGVGTIDAARFVHDLQALRAS